MSHLHKANMVNSKDGAVEQAHSQLRSECCDSALQKRIVIRWGKELIGTEPKYDHDTCMCVCHWSGLSCVLQWLLCVRCRCVLRLRLKRRSGIGLQLDRLLFPLCPSERPGTGNASSRLHACSAAPPLSVRAVSLWMASATHLHRAF